MEFLRISECLHWVGILVARRLAIVSSAPLQSGYRDTLSDKFGQTLVAASNRRWIAMSPSILPLYTQAATIFSGNKPMILPRPSLHSRINTSEHCIELLNIEAFYHYQTRSHLNDFLKSMVIPNETEICTSRCSPNPAWYSILSPKSFTYKQGWFTIERITRQSLPLCWAVHHFPVSSLGPHSCVSSQWVVKWVWAPCTFWLTSIPTGCKWYRLGLLGSYPNTTLHEKTLQGSPWVLLPWQFGGVLSPTVKSLSLVNFCLEGSDKTTFHWWVLSTECSICQEFFRCVENTWKKEHLLVNAHIIQSLYILGRKTCVNECLHQPDIALLW